MKELKQLRVLLFIVLIFSFQACVSTSSIKSIAQTNSASQIEEYKSEVLKLLLKYKEKLDLRNPYSCNKDLASNINHQIRSKQDYINIIENDKKLKTYEEYLHYAFSENEIRNRNDFLILGMYKLIYQAFAYQKNHTFAASQYDKKSMIKLYETLQVIRWKVRTNKDKNNQYLFKTWQNNWQLELENSDLNDLNIIKQLKYIKNNQESIFDHSNFSFEILISSMLVNIEHILRKINIEPYEMGISAIKSFVFIL
ncbi:hypothetical protein GCM10012288_03730 [Malaciobacter pacificus]|uniref:Uncharacterized protein n=1 Tax=Malaciobacter pacificus TaxID=1080223 RepID=A0A5C2H4P1_9BACT|nr:hypothetical protein [Malaciobacter pacificus]QEP33753.1 hypothetical protein APAC_0604 [Malaciobacter pacificus]GGD33044.1 hypothetical protein GCM10012288_03730 [Malaciobacter pacificus]